jgi:Domain of unknown function (DUF5134)
LPVTLALLPALLMVAVGLYCAVRPFAARYWRRSTEYDVDLVHAAMGMAMAAMLAGRLSAPWSEALAVLFTVAVLWFGGRAFLGRHQPSAGHHLAHTVTSGSMLVMLGPGTLAGPAAIAPPLLLGLVLALACSLVLAAGRLVPAVGPARAGGAPDPAGTGGYRPPLCPRLAGACHIGMGVVMIGMLLPML